MYMNGLIKGTTQHSTFYVNDEFMFLTSLIIIIVSNHVK